MIHTPLCFFAAAAILAAAVSCKTPRNVYSSSLNEISIRKETTEFPATVPVLIESINRSGSCTGTFIGKRVMLTAAHCIGESIGLTYFNGSNEIDLSGGKIRWSKSLHDIKFESFATRAFVNRKYEKVGECFSAYDFAIIEFKDDIPMPTAPLYKEAPKVGLQGKSVGYGASEDKDLGPKRYSDQTIMRVPGVFFGSERNQEGDSGGPFMIDGAIGGIISQGNSLFSPLNFASSLEVFKEAKQAGLDIPDVGSIETRPDQCEENPYSYIRERPRPQR